MVEMTCMTTKKKFEAVSPEVIELRNGRFAYRVQCPWDGKGGRKLFAFKFASRAAYVDYINASTTKEDSDTENSEESS
jgi:hypothetical protein